MSSRINLKYTIEKFEKMLDNVKEVDEQLSEIMKLDLEEFERVAPEKQRFLIIREYHCVRNLVIDFEQAIKTMKERYKDYGSKRNIV